MESDVMGEGGVGGAGGAAGAGRVSFGEDFRRFFLRGLAALLPTLITIWLLLWLWRFLWENIGQYLLLFLGWVWETLAHPSLMPFRPGWYLRAWLDAHLPWWGVQGVGVMLAVLTVYLAGLLVGNFIGRTAWRVLEVAVMKVPFVRAIYPAVKQVTDFVLAERSGHFQSSRVVAVQPHEKGIWSIGLVTGTGLRGMEKGTGGREMATVFVPSSPTAFSGYVLVVPREEVVELPMTVEEAMRLLVSGGVIVPGMTGKPGVAVGKAVGAVAGPEVAGGGVANVGRA